MIRVEGSFVFALGQTLVRAFAGSGLNRTGLDNSKARSLISEYGTIYLSSVFIDISIEPLTHIQYLTFCSSRRKCLSWLDFLLTQVCVKMVLLVDMSVTGCSLASPTALNYAPHSGFYLK